MRRETFTRIKVLDPVPGVDERVVLIWSTPQDEERAKQKDEIQKVVIYGGEFRQVDFKPREIVSLLLDDEGNQKKKEKKKLTVRKKE